MENKKKQLEAVNDIKLLMERSSRFTSLSGSSGIAAGIVAIAGAIVASLYLKIGFFEQANEIMIQHKDPLSATALLIIVLAMFIFIFALILAIFFSSKKAKRKKIIFWDRVAKRVFLNYFIFLLTGGIFCLILLYYGIYFLIVSSMLTFYGLALINVSKFTFNEFAQLGIIEICLGIISAFVTIYPLLFWLIGFGILHLIYGAYVYIKYEKV
ncbi:MAG: hypothetical protein M3R36_12945 [Bacteroidota bacterium]|nr:hypothetical protein [Bacteroidota bacterium]